MDYGLPDNTGVNHDLPLLKQQKIPGRGRGFLHRKPVIGGGHVPQTQTDMETQIHQVEQEAYTSVLRAFKAQSDAITWEKESLITELRKELRVSDEEHRELLSRVNAEEIINEIREWRTTSGLQPGSHSAPDRKPRPTVSASRKKSKTSHSVASMSLEVPSSMWSQPVQPSAFGVSTKGLKKISPEDVRWKSQDRGIVHGIGHHGKAHGLQKPVLHGTGGGKVGCPIKRNSRIHIPASLKGTERDSFGDIEILHTDTLIKEVEQVLNVNHPDPAELEKVKKVLKDHEKALVDAIARLGNASDGESADIVRLKGQQRS